MLEAGYNTIFKNSMRAIGAFAYKIPDAMGVSAMKTVDRPFDGIFSHSNFIGCWEGKRVKGIMAFNFRHFEDQQIPALLDYKKEKVDRLSLAVIYFDIPRNSQCVLIDVNLIQHLQANGVNSILKKQWKKLSAYFIVKKRELFDLTDIHKKILTVSIWNAVIGEML